MRKPTLSGSLATIIALAIFSTSCTKSAEAPSNKAETTTTESSKVDTVTAKIKSFECGDNCYLTITGADGKDVTGLCTADICKPWNDATEMPKDLIGRTISVKVGVGKQYDSAGNLMGEFPSFDNISLISQ